MISFTFAGFAWTLWTLWPPEVAILGVLICSELYKITLVWSGYIALSHQVVQFACEEEPQAETPRAQAAADEEDDFFDAVEDPLPTVPTEARPATSEKARTVVVCYRQSWHAANTSHFFKFNFILLFFVLASDCILLRWFLCCDLEIFGPCFDAPIQS